MNNLPGKFFIIIGMLCFVVSCMSVREGEETRGEGTYPEACSYCHGSSENPAPPPNLDGASDSSSRGVGAHQIHLNTTRATIDCSDCHQVPEDVSDEGHVDSDSPAEVIFGSRAKTGGLGSSWDGTKCSNVYCHGDSLAGGTHSDFIWDETAATTCTDCHGMPPTSGEYHGSGETTCSPCHSSITPETHVDGKTDLWE